jgi:CRISPR-associated endonuclease Cas1 subtype II
MAGFRTIVINKRCKLESRLGAMVIRSETEELVHIAEIETLLIESPAVALTSSLVADLTESGTNIIFCDRKHLPTAIFTPVHAHFSCTKNIKEQLAWSDERKAKCWGLIIKEKIRQQALHLIGHSHFDDNNLLKQYADKVDDGDTENYEARAAALYFRSLFGKNFSRNDACFENDALNYSYTLIMAAFARNITACGYLTELGIWHRGVENAFNLASDLMEPFRPIADRCIIAIPDSEKPNYKRYMLGIMCSKVRINGECQSFVPAIRIFLHRIFRFMSGEVDQIFTLELGESLSPLPLGEGE